MFTSIFSFGQGYDLPNPPANIDTISSGSLIIAMDTTNQGLVSPFNLKAYGLAYALLANQVPLKWAIKSGKSMGGTDFTASVIPMYPTPGAPASISFRGGPFIIDVAYFVTADSVINAFGNDVAVYLLISDEPIDIRYTISYKPKIAVLDNGSYSVVLTEILDSAALTSYDIILAESIDDSGYCYTYCCEPHWETLTLTDTNITNVVKTYVENGGNFFTSCMGIATYCNYCFYHSTSGISIINSIPESHTYYNSDLAYMQMDGTVYENEAGGLMNWELGPGSKWHTFFYPAVASADTSLIIAGGAKFISPLQSGGNVFYLGGHDFTKGLGFSNLKKLNEMRMFLNGIFVPAQVLPSCNLEFATLPIELVKFSSVVKSDYIALEWSTAMEMNNDFFTIEKSINGLSFSPIARIKSNGNSFSQQHYSISDKDPFNGTSYYRLSQTDLDGRTKVVGLTSAVYMNASPDCIISVTPNPCYNQCQISLSGCENDDFVTIGLYDIKGNKITSTVPVKQGNGFYINNTNNLAPGTYIIYGSTKKDKINKKISVQ